MRNSSENSLLVDRRYADRRVRSISSPVLTLCARSIKGSSITSFGYSLNFYVNSITAQNATRHYALVNFIGPVIDSCRAFVAIPVSEYGVVGQAQSSMDLNCPVQHTLKDAGNKELNKRNTLAPGSCALAVDSIGRIHNEKSCRGYLGAALCNPMLDALAAGKRDAGRKFTPRSPPAHHFECSLANTHPAHAMLYTPRPQAFLRYPKPIALDRKQIRLGNPAIFLYDFSVTCVITSLVTHDTDISDDAKARRRSWDDDLASSLVRTCGLRVSHRHHDREGSTFRRRCKPLVTVDYIVVAVLHSGRAHPGRVLPGMFRLR